VPASAQRAGPVPEPLGADALPSVTRGPRRDVARSLLLLGAMLAALVAVRWSLTGSLSEPLAPPVPTVPDAVQEAPQRLEELRGGLLYLGGRRPLVADLGSGTLSPLPAGQNRPTRVLRHGRFVLLTANGRASVLSPFSRDGWNRPRPLGQAGVVLPSPLPDRAWLVDDQQARPAESTYLLQEVDLDDGRRLRTLTLPYDATPVAVVAGGVLTRDPAAGMQLRDLRSGRVRQRLGTGLTFLDVHGGLVAYLATDGLHLRDLGGRRDRMVAPPAGGSGWVAPGTGLPADTVCCLQSAAFAPDGRSLATFVRLAGPSSPGIALVDVERGQSRLLPGSAGASPVGCLPCLGWSPGGWLFFFAATPQPAAVAAWRPGRERATVLDLDLGLGGLSGVVPSGLAAADGAIRPRG
jgi:hypothetical protein